MSDKQTSERPPVTDAEMLARFQGSKNRPPCSETLDMKLVEVCQAESRIAMSFTAAKAFTNPMGTVQGGFVAAMLDEAMSTCAIIASNVTMTAPTLEMKISYLRPLFPGPATAKARILKWGNSAAFLEAELAGADGKIVAKATATAAPKPFKRLSKPAD